MCKATLSTSIGPDASWVEVTVGGQYHSQRDQPSGIRWKPGHAFHSDQHRDSAHANTPLSSSARTHAPRAPPLPAPYTPRGPAKFEAGAVVRFHASEESPKVNCSTSRTRSASVRWIRMPELSTADTPRLLS